MSELTEEKKTTCNIWKFQIKPEWKSKNLKILKEAISDRL